MRAEPVSPIKSNQHTASSFVGEDNLHTDDRQELKLFHATAGVVTVPGVFEAFYRAGSRFLEASLVTNPLIRGLVRFPVELVRNGISNSLTDVLENKKVSKLNWINSAKLAVTNSLASTFFEPYRYESPIARILAGAANMLIRLVVQVFFEGLDTIDSITDYISSGSVPRTLYTGIENPTTNIVTNTAQQVVVNAWRNIKPLKSFKESFF
ncbi:MAG: hypothetical protein HYY52_04795 [Candidatus Melainabacteria bacterium]|nr:hypothetical protein [Candidatus Melainabacteria bacterium]